MGTFTLNDPRGEYWLYTGEGLAVNVGRGVVDGVCHFNTGDIHLESGGPLGSAKVAEILAELMLSFGRGLDGYPKLLLHHDGGFELSPGDIAVIDRALSAAGFTMRHDPAGKETQWARGQ